MNDKDFLFDFIPTETSVFSLPVYIDQYRLHVKDQRLQRTFT